MGEGGNKLPQGPPPVEFSSDAELSVFLAGEGRRREEGVITKKNGALTDTNRETRKLDAYIQVQNGN